MRQIWAVNPSPISTYDTSFERSQRIEGYRNGQNARYGFYRAAGFLQADGKVGFSRKLYNFLLDCPFKAIPKIQYSSDLTLSNELSFKKIWSLIPRESCRLFSKLSRGHGPLFLDFSSYSSVGLLRKGSGSTKRPQGRLFLNYFPSFCTDASCMSSREAIALGHSPWENNFKLSSEGQEKSLFHLAWFNKGEIER